MSTAIPNSNTSPPPSPTLRAPTTLAHPSPPAFTLTQGNLQHILAYSTTSYGQTSVISRIALPPGSHLCYITTHSPIDQTTWSSIQTSRTHHIELNSALLYMNHSCAPTVDVVVHAPSADDGNNYPDGIAGEVRVVRDRELQVGDHLTYFYPSTEWASPRPFECLCGARDTRRKCIGVQRGSKYLSKEVLDRYFVNDHVGELVADRDLKEEVGAKDSVVRDEQ